VFPFEDGRGKKRMREDAKRMKEDERGYL